MTKAQRILILVWLVVIAWMLHVSFCEWGLQTRNLVRLMAFPHGTTTYAQGRNPNPPVVTTYSGVFAERSVNSSVAVLLGVLLPLTLVATDIYLLLGWRAQSRIARNLCTKCGYDLRGTEHEMCPECGVEVYS